VSGGSQPLGPMTMGQGMPNSGLARFAQPAPFSFPSYTPPTFQPQQLTPYRGGALTPPSPPQPIMSDQGGDATGGAGGGGYSPAENGSSGSGLFGGGLAGSTLGQTIGALAPAAAGMALGPLGYMAANAVVGPSSNFGMQNAISSQYGLNSIAFDQPTIDAMNAQMGPSGYGGDGVTGGGYGGDAAAASAAGVGHGDTVGGFDGSSEGSGGGGGGK